MAASFQEEFVAEMSRASLGAYSVFEPQTYRKGNSTREPADLAWSSSDAVILFYMQAGGRSQAKHDRHNLRQMEGWMRAWFNGEPLTGRNDSRAFSIAFAEVKTVLLVSVSGDPAAEMIVAPFVKTKSDRVNATVMAMVSIPEEVLLRLAQLGGAAIDLADLVLRVAAQNGRASKTEAVDYLADQRQWSMNRALASKRLRWDRDTDLDNWVYMTIAMGLRRTYPEGASPPTHFDAFNDLDWESSALLALLCADAFRQVRDVEFGAIGPVSVATQLDLNPYRFFIAAYDVMKAPDFVEDLVRAEAASREESVGVPTIGMHWQMVGRPIVEFSSGILTFGREEQYESATSCAFRETRAVLNTTPDSQISA